MKSRQVFIDYPHRIDGKIIFDGRFFLGQRHYFDIVGILEYKIRGETKRTLDLKCFKRRHVLISPNKINGEVAVYSKWFAQQEL